MSLMAEGSAYQLYQGDCLQIMRGMEPGSIDAVITDAPYDLGAFPLEELRRICKGNVVTFCAPENQFYKPDEFAWWVKTPSTKNYSKHLGRFVEMILILRGGAFNCLHWSQMTGVYDDRHIEPQEHPFEKPLSLMERLVRIYTRPGELVLDCFMGSGRTGEACRNTGRRFVGIERDPAYFAIAKRRI